MSTKRCASCGREIEATRESTSGDFLQRLIDHLRRDLKDALPEARFVSDVTKGPDAGDKSFSRGTVEFEHHGTEVTVELEVDFHLDTEKGSVVWNMREGSLEKVKDEVIALMGTDEPSRVAENLADEIVEQFFLY